MSQEHTPGPWEVSAIDDRTIQHIDGSWAPVVGDVKTGDRIPRWQGIAMVKQRAADETRANARLIAAAPEMLEALRRASYQLATDDGDRLSLRKQIDAVIAKTEGAAS